MSEYQPDPVRVAAQAPGKVNILLKVGDVDAQGYHTLTTVFQAMDTYEEVILSTTGKSISQGESAVSKITTEGLGADKVPCDDSNLAARAVNAVAQQVMLDAVQESVQFPQVDVHIVKHIPVAGGMAGGSADAAASLVAARAIAEQYCGVSLADSEIYTLAVGLGADVPFCLLGGTAWAIGRGDILTPLHTPENQTYWWVLALTDAGLSTPTVFHTLDDIRSTTGEQQGILPEQETVSALLSSAVPADIAAQLDNDLQEAACHLLPQLDTLLKAAENTSIESQSPQSTFEPVGAVLSGSGPTVAFLAEDEQHAHQLASTLEKSGLCDSVFITAAPGHGARIITNNTHTPTPSTHADK